MHLIGPYIIGPNFIGPYIIGPYLIGPASYRPQYYRPKHLIGPPSYRPPDIIGHETLSAPTSYQNMDILSEHNTLSALYIIGPENNWICLDIPEQVWMAYYRP